ncbi:hypothetical protein ABBQ32_14197 [Trebouxia sp. C0010 RCD-2024]
MEPHELNLLQHQVSQAVNAWREMPTAAEAAASSSGDARPSQDIRRTVGMSGVTTVCAGGQQHSPASASKPSTSTAAPAASADDEDDEIQVLKEQSLDEVLEERRLKAERTGQMIDLTKDVSPAVLAATAAKLEAEQRQRDEEEAQKALVEATKAFDIRLEEARADLRNAAAALEKERQAMSASTSDPGSVSTAAGIAAKPRNNNAVADSDSDVEIAAPAEVKAEPSSAVKRRSPVQPALQPAAKKGRLLRQRSPPASAVDASMDSDETMEECLSPRRTAKARKNAVESDDDEDYVVPGSAAKSEVLDLTEDTACEVCSSAEDADHMLLCDKCNRGYHVDCLVPPMASIPPGEWFCQKCEAKRTRIKGKGTVGIGQKGAAARALVSDSDTDADDIQAPPSKPAAGQMTSRQGTLLSMFARQNAQSSNPKVRMLAAEKQVTSAEVALQRAERDLERAVENAKRVKLEPSEQAARSTRAASAPKPAATPSSTARVKAEPASGAAGAAAAGSAAPSTSTKASELGASKPSSTKRVGGGRDGYAVVQDVLDDDWEDKLEDDGDQLSSPEQCPQMVRIRGMLLRLLDIMELPPNPLDQLTDLMGGEEKVAEMTGRKGLLRREADGTVSYQQRCPEETQKMINVKEKQAFMNSNKLIAIISDAASVGISLQADKRVVNQRRRCHLTLELPWSADKAIQQFGRSHRSNQTSAPIYRIVVSACAGEYRFASSAAKRLQSLGALLKGDRRALGAGEDLKGFDVDNKWGKKALDRIYTDILGSTDQMPGVQAPHLPAALKGMGADGGWAHNSNVTRTGQEFFKYMRSALTAVGLISKVTHHFAGPVYSILEKNKTVTKFLNRMLAMSLRDQKLLFAYFSDTLVRLPKVVTNCSTLFSVCMYLQLLLDGTEIQKTSHDIGTL